ncbi:serine/threonine-protein kinase RsbT [Arcticibacter tournemirensis]|uniref:anti-sigma regulatory factor n=1 Tax=Arcticibacter tournemirensis TaxID=699437 RepID=UPI00116FC6F3|nr:anti-sigma regulatory factor [Arcticibacter tournemirensis]TQM51600.1 serine/threonine-protein kinase RsbT [Arcticibacter tournemirensis]
MIIPLSKDIMYIVRDQDVVPFRNRVKEKAVKIKMGLVNQTKLITAASELVRNMLKYANGGEVLIEIVSKGRDTGIRLVFKDKGPGIADISMAMKDGFSTGKSLGLGLPGARRLVSEFDIKSESGKGTTVSIIKWANG